jgi:hypothetical protein
MVMMMIDTSLKHTSDVVGRILQSINLGGNCSTKIYGFMLRRERKWVGRRERKPSH